MESSWGDIIHESKSKSWMGNCSFALRIAIFGRKIRQLLRMANSFRQNAHSQHVSLVFFEKEVVVDRRGAKEKACQQMKHKFCDLSWLYQKKFMANKWLVKFSTFYDVSTTEGRHHGQQNPDKLFPSRVFILVINFFENGLLPCISISELAFLIALIIKIQSRGDYI